VSVDEKAGLATTLTEKLTAEIFQGRYPAGAPLRQAQLAGRFNVSRTPVREALHRLVATGLASFEPNSGFRVRSIPRDEYLDAMLIRARLEGLAAERAVQRVTCEQMQELESAAEEIDRIGRHLSSARDRSDRAEDQDAWSRGNARFHGLLVDFSECPPLATALSTTIRAYPRDVLWLAWERFPGLLAEYSEDHFRICEGFRAGDPGAARAAAQAHVERAIRNLRIVFREEADAESSNGKR
jgi:DNA-binding GntR family transcriptional regulator